MGIITAPDLKEFRGIDDDIDDAVIDWAVDAANRAVIEHCGRDFSRTETADATARVLYADDGCELDVWDFWSTTGLIVKTDSGDDGTYDTTWTINTDFIVEPLNGLDESGQTVPYCEIKAIGGKRFPTWGRRPQVQITAAWGWASVPAPVFQAALLIANRFASRRKSPEGVLGGFQDYSAVRVSQREDPDALRMLAPFRKARMTSLIG